MINPLGFAVAVDQVDLLAVDAAKHALASGATLALSWKVDLVPRREFVPRGLLTCVSVVKAVLGISAWFVLTPEHLARWMIRNGAQRLEI